MRGTGFSQLFIALLALLMLNLSLLGQSDRPAIIGYVFPQNGPVRSADIDAHSVTRINYAFATIQNGRMLISAANDGPNISQLTALRQLNPSLTVLISVGGWLGSGGFSDMALTEKSRGLFIKSTLELLKSYDLDGVDVDWEYPGLTGAGNKFRSEDKHNFTLLLKELRDQLTIQSKMVGRRLYLTIAAGADDEYLAHTEMAQVAQYVDTVNLMAYDYYEAGSDTTTGNHAPLFLSPADPKRASANTAVKAYEAAGVPARKLILGVPFYGRIWGQVPNINHGLFQPGKPVPNGNQAYSTIRETMLNHGYTRYWDQAAMAPYLYNEEKQIFVSYEDSESLAAKCSYVVGHKLGGVMFWSYFNDPSGELLHTINRALQSSAAASAAK
jgi:chitinase